MGGNRDPPQAHLVLGWWPCWGSPQPLTHTTQDVKCRAQPASNPHPNKARLHYFAPQCPAGWGGRVQHPNSQLGPPKTLMLRTKGTKLEQPSRCLGTDAGTGSAHQCWAPPKQEKTQPRLMVTMVTNDGVPLLPPTIWADTTKKHQEQINSLLPP